MLCAGLVMSAGVAQGQGARGQKPPIELGIDAGLSIDFDSPTTTTIAIPAQQIRVGFLIRPRISLEPNFALNVSSGGGSHFTTYQAGVGLLYHFSVPRSDLKTYYVRPFIGMAGYSSSGTSGTQAVIGGGFGVKIPLVSRIASRFEVNYTHAFSSGDLDSQNKVGLLAGLSFFTR
jgi:hypothetical protein